MTTQDQETPPIDLEQFRRSLKLLAPDPEDVGGVQLMRLYLPVANGDAGVDPLLLKGIEQAAGGSLCVGTMPVRAKDGVPEWLDLQWCERLVGVAEAFRRDGQLPRQSVPEGRWLGIQRRSQRTGKLSPARKAKLDEAFPGWFEANDHDAYFEAVLARVVGAFLRDGQLPKQSVPEGRWLGVQRHKHKSGKLSSARQAMLDEAIPGWFEANDHHAQFVAALSRAVDAFRRDGHLPKHSTPEGVWLGTRRQDHKGGRLSLEHKAMLDEAIPGWFEASDHHAQFMAALSRAAEAFRREGRLPKSTTPEGSWLSAQRKKLKNDRLSLERQAMIDEAIPGWFETRGSDAQFEAALMRAVEAFRREGKLPDKSKPEGAWLGRQRRGLRNGRLPLARQAMLDVAIPGWRETRDDQFEAVLKRAVETFRRDGHLPKRPTPEGMWLETQRQNLKSGKLSPARQAVLDEAIPGWRETRGSDAQFEAALTRAKEAFNRDGQLPKQSTPEGVWLKSRRQDLIKGRLSPARKEMLDETLPGWREGNDYDARFDAALTRAKEVFIRHGQIPKRPTPEGSWLKEQRQNRRMGKLSTARQAMLDEALPGWFEATNLDAHFEDSLARAVKAFRRDGQLPRKTTPEGTWLGNRRRDFKKGTLSPSRQAMLDEAIPGWSEAISRAAQFDTSLARAKEVFRQDGQFPKRSTPEGSWLAARRQDLKNGTLSLLSVRPS